MCLELSQLYTAVARDGVKSKEIMRQESLILHTHRSLNSFIAILTQQFWETGNRVPLKEFL